MKTNSISTEVTATITDDNRLVISIPLKSNPKLTKNEKNYVVAETGTWPQNWVTVAVDGEEVGLTLCALVKNPEHPDNKPAPVAPPVPPAPKFFVKKAAAAAKPVGNGTLAAKRIMPGSCA
jgi:hypothetical protein